MTLLAVNVGTPRAITYNNKTVLTGIFKAPLRGRARVGPTNIEGDQQADLQAHGGVDKAVYAYPYAHYPTWARELARDDFTYGQFGENLTLGGDWIEDQVHIGDVFRIGSAVLQVSQPRTPCFKLGVKMGDARFVKTFTQANRPGFYLRVLEAGELGAGDSVERLQIDPAQMSVAHIFSLRHLERGDRQTLERAAQLAALASGWRRAFSQRLQNA